MQDPMEVYIDDEAKLTAMPATFPEWKVALTNFYFGNLALEEVQVEIHH